MTYTAVEIAEAFWTSDTRTLDANSPESSIGSYVDDIGYAVWTNATRELDLSMIDTREKRASVLGVGRPWYRTKSPQAAKNGAWRATSGNSYAFDFSGGAAPRRVRLGSTQINKIYLSSTEIKKVYLGATLIHDTTG